MRQFFAIRSQAAPPAYEKVVSVVVLTILFGFVLAAFGNPRRWQAILEGPQQAQDTQRHVGYDGYITKFIAGTYPELARSPGSPPGTTPTYAPGNIILTFRNFDMSDPKVQGLVQWYYYRAAYAAYPNRVFVADANTVIPHQPLYTPPIPDFDPSADWAAAHNVKRKVVLAQQPDGRPGFSVQEISPSGKP